MAPLSPGLACVRQWGDHNVTPDPRPFFVPSRFELSKLRKKNEDGILNFQPYNPGLWVLRFTMHLPTNLDDRIRFVSLFDIVQNIP